MTAAPELSWPQLIKILGPNGQDEIVAFFREARQKHGATWRHHIEIEFPLASWLVDLVANHTDDQALDQICEEFPNMPIRLLAATQIKTLHAKLRHEIEVKR